MGHFLVEFRTFDFSIMIQTVHITERDQQELAKLRIDPGEVKNDFYNYSKVVVKKPWGYEYLLFANDLIAVWVLYLKKGAQTSMHCHPNKKTSLIVLEGEGACATLIGEIRRQAGEGLLIDKGVFHQTTTLSETGAFVMEIETPVNKRDLVRLKDKYGRAGQGYETELHHTFNTQNYNYLSFDAPPIHHNFQKRFGQCSLTFHTIEDMEESEAILQSSHDADVFCVLSG